MRIAVLALLAAASGAAQPVIPVGLDAYRMWDRWACRRIGARAYMRSTSDRRGGNEKADALPLHLPVGRRRQRGARR